MDTTISRLEPVQNFAYTATFLVLLCKNMYSLKFT